MTCKELLGRLSQEIQIGMSRVAVESILDDYQLPHTYRSREEIGPLGETPFEAWKNEDVVGRIASTRADQNWPSDGTFSLSLKVYFDKSGRVKDRRMKCLRMSP